MPRLLEGSELEDAVRWMGEAVAISLDSPCKRDKRGVVIVDDGKIIGVGVNAPPEGYECRPENCEPTCKGYAVHAEMNAIRDAVSDAVYGSIFSFNDAVVYHARSENGVLVDSRKPRCLDCAKNVLLFEFGGFVLKHSEGYTLYSAKELYEVSLKHQKEVERK